MILRHFPKRQLVNSRARRRFIEQMQNYSEVFHRCALAKEQPFLAKTVTYRRKRAFNSSNFFAKTVFSEPFGSNSFRKAKYHFSPMPPPKLGLRINFVVGRRSVDFAHCRRPANETKLVYFVKRGVQGIENIAPDTLVRLG